ncbi:MAG: immunity 53 family protein [Alphaproteobacteria bacterium]
MNELEWLENYYLSCCDGDWEHQFGVKIGTLDNPGWELEIALEETFLEEVPFEKIHDERTENNWVVCFVKDEKFLGYGGPQNLRELIRIFREWVESHEDDA